MKAGTLVYIKASVYDNTVTPPVLFDPATSVTITIRNPSGNAVVTNAAMTKVSTGVYYYKHQTQVGDPAGFWSGDIKATDSSDVGLSTVGLFTLEA